jgi:predicted metal-dependent hydrolase
MMKATITRPDRKTVSLHIKPDATIVIKAPHRFPIEKIKKLIQEHTSWIQQKQQTLLSRNTIKTENEYWYLGKTYSLAIRQQQKQIVELTDKFYIASSSQTYIKRYITSWYKQQARVIITERVKHYANKAQLTYRSLAIANAETRWGSCSSKKTLNFNWKLVMAPIEVIDYVVSHELAHLTHLNHSADFWESVRKIYPVYRQHRTWLKRFGHLLKI